jgi:hypothetical protein
MPQDPKDKKRKSFIRRSVRSVAGSVPAMIGPSPSKKMKKTISKISHRESSPLAPSPRPVAVGKMSLKSGAL